MLICSGNAGRGSGELRRWLRDGRSRRSGNGGGFYRFAARRAKTRSWLERRATSSAETVLSGTALVIHCVLRGQYSHTRDGAGGTSLIAVAADANRGSACASVPLDLPLKSNPVSLSSEFGGLCSTSTCVLLFTFFFFPALHAPQPVPDKHNRPRPRPQTRQRVRR